MQQQIFLSLRTNESARGQIIDDHQRINNENPTKRISNYKQSNQKSERDNPKPDGCWLPLFVLILAPLTQEREKKKKKKSRPHPKQHEKSDERRGVFISDIGRQFIFVACHFLQDYPAVGCEQQGRRCTSLLSDPPSSFSSSRGQSLASYQSLISFAIQEAPASSLIVYCFFLCTP